MCSLLKGKAKQFSSCHHNSEEVKAEEQEGGFKETGWIAPLGAQDLSPLNLRRDQENKFTGVVEGDEVSPQPPLLQTKPPQFPQPLPIRPVLQTLHQPRCPSLDTLESFNVLFGVRGPNLNPGIKVQPHQCRAQG
ncbi:unnamed protein product [Bubo scandiacus]